MNKQEQEEIHVCIFPSKKFTGKFGVVILQNKTDYDFERFIGYDIFYCEEKLATENKTYSYSKFPVGYFSKKSRALKYAEILSKRNNIQLPVEFLEDEEEILFI